MPQQPKFKGCVWDSAKGPYAPFRTWMCVFGGIAANHNAGPQLEGALDLPLLQALAVGIKSTSFPCRADFKRTRPAPTPTPTPTYVYPYPYPPPSRAPAMPRRPASELK